MSTKIGEPTINNSIGNVLRGMHPRWKEKGRIITENRKVISGEEAKKPDIVICHPEGLPVVIESELYPDAKNVEAEARARLGKKLEKVKGGRKSNLPVEQVIALRIPKELEDADQGILDDEVQKFQYEFCVHFTPRESRPEKRWPKSGWIEGSLEDLALFVEHASLSQDAVDNGMKVLEIGIKEAAGDLREACDGDSQMTLEKIANSLYQEDCEQTTRMAMAIVINALSFHISIARTKGAENIKTLDELKSNGIIQKGKLLKAWRLIRKINYKPIFKIAAKILKPIRNGTAHMILEQLSDVASELDSLGATSQHDLSGRMLQRLIADREFLATYYTRPSSAALLAELSVSRLNTNWSNENEVTNLKVADFACGTGALLNAAYGAMMSRYRRGGGRRFKDTSEYNRACSYWNGHYASRNSSHNVGSFKRSSNGEIWKDANCHSSLRRKAW